MTISVNSRPLTSFAPLADELMLNPTQNYLFDLSYLTGLRVTGDNAQTFLQGQLSCDVREVNEQQMRQGALCNLQGRVLALIDIIRWGSAGLDLILPRDLITATQGSLAKTAMLSRVTLNPVNEYQLFGFYLQNPKDIIPFQLELTDSPYHVVSQSNCCCYSVGNNFYIFLVATDHSQAVCDQFINNSQWRGSLAWHALQLQQKRIDIYPTSRGLFLPHRLDLQRTSCLSFNKGCYKGQEIIARMHYRATLKHELKVFTLQTNETLKSGQKIFTDGDREIGEIVDYCPLGDEKYLVVASALFDMPLIIRIEGHKDSIAWYC